ncbi:hypothetical protein AB0C27_25275 [Nonomuraea sp. NPDC048882]|uniref:hypothetical protein n=1 Tax=Nonomuraea sp. NPDC048882 TaxID=3154347 RepID=UPI0033F41C3D
MDGVPEAGVPVADVPVGWTFIGWVPATGLAVLGRACAGVVPLAGVPGLVPVPPGGRGLSGFGPVAGREPPVGSASPDG